MAALRMCLVSYDSLRCQGMYEKFEIFRILKEKVQKNWIKLQSIF